MKIISKSSLVQARNNCVAEYSRHLLILLLILFGQNSVALADETSADKTVMFNIIQQRADLALTEFAEQADLTLIFSPELVQEKLANALSGEYTLSEGVRILLAGTGLSPTFSNQVVLSIVIDEKSKFVGKHMKVKKKAGLGAFLAAIFSINAGAQDSESNVESGDAEKEEIEEILVTGSRIARSTFTTPYPMVSVDSERFEMSGLTAGELLEQNPVFGAGKGTAFSAGNTDSGAIFLNLRGLGTNRTLTVIDGRRRVSGSKVQSAVDLSTIPVGMIDRVEVITGGAAAVYGADAVTGVINVILKDDFEGIETSFNHNMVEETGAGITSFNFLTGSGFGDGKGAITLGVSHTQMEEVRGNEYPDYTARSFFIATNLADTGPNDGIPALLQYPRARFPTFSYEGAFFVGGNRYVVDTDTGQARRTQNDVEVFGPNGFLGQGGDGFSGGDSALLRNAQDTTTIMTNLDYTIADNLKLFVESDFSLAKSFAPGTPTFDSPGSVISLGNPFIPANLEALMVANSLDSISVFRTNRDQGGRDAHNDRNTFNIVAGFEGNFSNDWGWQAFAQYGRYQTTSKIRYYRVETLYNEALDAITDPVTGNTVCRSESARSSGCVPVNILGEQQNSEEALNYFRHTGVFEGVNTMSVFGGQVSGDLMDLAAGSLQFASGIEYRKEHLTTENDGLAQQGLLGLDSAGKGVSKGFDVTEGFVEVFAPIMLDKPFFQSLSLDAAVRYSDYSTIGSTVAWKAGLNWAPVEDLRFRVTQASSVRAPSLFELFNPGVSGLAGITDPCDVININSGSTTREQNCRALGIPVGWVDPARGTSQATFSGGNAELTEETSKSLTVGFVFTPASLPRLSVSADLWDIEIEDAVGSIGLGTAAAACVDATTIDNVFCSLIERGGEDIVGNADAYSITLGRITEINIGRLSARGVDFQASYDFDVMSKGNLELVLNTTYLMEHDELGNTNDDQTLIVKKGDFLHQRVRGTLSAKYTVGDLSANLITRYVGGAREDVNGLDGPEGVYPNKFGAVVFHDLVMAHQFDSGMRLYGGINNLTNKFSPDSASAVSSALYDILGRNFTIGAQFKW